MIKKGIVVVYIYVYWLYLVPACWPHLLSNAPLFTAGHSHLNTSAEHQNRSINKPTLTIHTCCYVDLLFANPDSTPAEHSCRNNTPADHTCWTITALFYLHLQATSTAYNPITWTCWSLLSSSEHIRGVFLLTTTSSPAVCVCVCVPRLLTSLL